MKNKTKSFATILLIHFTIIISIISVFIIIYDNNYRNQMKQNIIQSSDYELKLIFAIFNNNFSNVFSDLKYISSTLDTNNINEYTDKTWLNFLKAKPNYDQLRYLNTNGKEILRVNKGNGEVYIVPDENLQNKKGRYYFDESIALNTGDFYISKFDLNIEDGAIEYPEKPTIRIALKVDNGVIIINYIASNILNAVSLLNDNKEFDLFILNNDNHYIYHPDRSKMFQFMYGDVSNFNDDYNNILSEINTGYIFKNNEFFNSTVIKNLKYKGNVTQNENLTIVYHQDGDASNQRFTHPSTSAFILYLIYHYLPIYISAILVVFILTTLKYKSLENKKKKTEASKRDGLTNIYNRKSGLEIIDAIIEKSEDKNIPLFFVFIDIDGLKIVNDTLGHEYGDELIRETTSIVAHVIRDNDIFLRYGGDEFIIVFKDITLDITESIMKRINKEIDYYNAYESDKFKISMSYGISNTKEIGYERNALINLADERMYEKKLEKKNAK